MGHVSIWEKYSRALRLVYVWCIGCWGQEKLKSITKSEKSHSFPLARDWSKVWRDETEVFPRNCFSVRTEVSFLPASHPRESARFFKPVWGTALLSDRQDWQKSRMRGKIKFNVSHVRFDRWCGNQAKDTKDMPNWRSGGEAGIDDSIWELSAYRCV